MQNLIDGRMWLSKSAHSFLGKGRIELLEAIEQTGSISKAAKAMKMSYKSAWDAVDAMNNLAEVELVERATGGKGGGGTHLTPYAKELIATYKVLNEEHSRFLENLSLRINENDGQLRLLDHMVMRVSARNQLLGSVAAIRHGAVYSEVVLKLKGDDTVTVMVTDDAIESLDLQIGSYAYALFKAGSVMLSMSNDICISTDNRFEGVIKRIERGSVNSEVILELDGGNTICATLANHMVDAMELKEGMRSVAFFNPNTVILGLV